MGKLGARRAALAAIAGLAAGLVVAAAVQGCQGSYDGPYTCEPGYATCGGGGGGGGSGGGSGGASGGGGNQDCTDYRCNCQTYVLADPNNCGACGNFCNGGVCIDGGCVGGSGSGSGGGDCRTTGCPSGQVCQASGGGFLCQGGTGSSSGSSSGGGPPRPPPLLEPLTQTAAAFGNDGKVYVVGGTNAQRMPSKTLYVYDPMLNSWSRGSDMINARTAACVTVANDGSVWAFGGFDASGNAVAAIEQHNAFSGVWAQMGTMTTPRGAMACGGFGQILAAGGLTSVSGTPLAIVESVPIMGGGGGSFPPMPTARAWAGGASVGNAGFNLVVIGGAPSLSVAEILDNNSWVTFASMPTGRANFGTATVNYMSDGIVMAVGGTDGSRVLSTLEGYDYQQHMWTTYQPMPTAREGLSAVALTSGPYGGTLLAIGGDDGASPPRILDTVEEYVTSQQGSTFSGAWQ